MNYERIEWRRDEVPENDAYNIVFFSFSTMKNRRNRNSIDVLKLTNIAEMRMEVVHYFSSLFSSITWSYPIDVDRIRTFIRGSLSPDQASFL